MIAVDLSPPRIVLMRALARRVRAWTFIAPAWVLLLAGVGLACRSLMHGDTEPQREALATLAAQNESAQAAASRMSARHRAQRAASAINRTLIDQPDWSTLLALLAACREQDIAFRSVSLRPEAARAAPAPDAARRDRAGGETQPASAPLVPAAYVLTLEGVALNQKSVASLLMALERTGLFRAVELVNSRRDSLNDTRCVAFTASCSLASSEP